MKKEEILKELKEKFEEVKKELNFKSSYEDINELCLLEDSVLNIGFVSNDFSKQLINKIIESFYSWLGILHSWLMPSPQDMIFMSEANKLDENEKNQVKKIVSYIMYLVRKNKRIEFQRDNAKKGEFIDEMINFGKGDFTKFMIKFHKKFELAWKESY